MSPTHKQGEATNNGTRVESIVGAVRTATQAEQAGVLSLIEVLIALNIVIGIVNMLPMLPLDGGHVAIAVYERIRTKKGQPYYVADAAKLLPVAYAFVAILLVIVARPSTSTSPTRWPTRSTRRAPLRGVAGARRQPRRRGATESGGGPGRRTCLFAGAGGFLTRLPWQPARSRWPRSNR